MRTTAAGPTAIPAIHAGARPTRRAAVHTAGRRHIRPLASAAHVAARA